MFPFFPREPSPSCCLELGEEHRRCPTCWGTLLPSSVLFFLLSPPDPRSSNKEVVRGLVRPPSFHPGVGPILGRNPRTFQGWVRKREANRGTGWSRQGRRGVPGPLRCVVGTSEDGAS